MITVWGKISGSYLYSNIGMIQPRNIYSFAQNLEGFFKYRVDYNVIDYVPTLKVLPESHTGI